MSGAAREGALAPASRSMTRLMWRRFLEHRLAAASGVVLAVLIVVTAAAPGMETLLGKEENEVEILKRLKNK